MNVGARAAARRQVGERSTGAGRERRQGASVGAAPYHHATLRPIGREVERGGVKRRSARYRERCDDRVDGLGKVEEGPLLRRADSQLQQGVATGCGKAKLPCDSHRPVGVEPVRIDGEKPKRGHGC